MHDTKYMEVLNQGNALFQCTLILLMVKTIQEGSPVRPDISLLIQPVDQAKENEFFGEVPDIKFSSEDGFIQGMDFGKRKLFGQ